MMKRFLSLALCCASLAGLSGCGTASGAQARDLMADIQARPLSAAADAVDGPLAANEFAVRLLWGCDDESANTLVSPLSVLAALGMTLNGAAGETRAQMESVLGMTAEELNGAVRQLTDGLPSEKTRAVHLANSIWFRDDPALTVERSFLQTNADYYGAAAYQPAFDEDAVEDINGWVRENTDGMIDGILEEIPEDAMLYLINALSFNGEWAEICDTNQVREGIFTTADGRTRTVDFLHSAEYRWLEDEHAQGFLKYYKGGDFAFAALLPEEGLSLSDYLAALTGARLKTALDGASDREVYVTIPKFETEYATELSGVLESMGMTDAFDMNAADFSAMGRYTDGNLYISRVLHRTKLTVDERGTRAGAVTAVEMAAGAAAPVEEPKVVCLDRPFVYALVDCRTNTPLFLGVVRDVGA